MVDISGYSIPNSYLGGGLGGILLIIILFWFMKSRQSGRIGEELQEERETDQLRVDEQNALRVERDEKKGM